MGGGGHVVGTHKWMKASNRFRWNITGSNKRLIGRIKPVLISQPKRWHANSLVTCKLIAPVSYLPADHRTADPSPASVWCLLTWTVSPLTQEQEPSPYFLTPPPLDAQWVFQGAHLMTVGVISAQKKMLKLLTAWEENIPMMEKAMEKFLFSVPEVSEHTDTHTHTRLVATLHTLLYCMYMHWTRLFKIWYCSRISGHSNGKI